MFRHSDLEAHPLRMHHNRNSYNTFVGKPSAEEVVFSLLTGADDSVFL